MTTTRLTQMCPDGGTCHHECPAGTRCWRVDHCEPLSGVFPDDKWPGTANTATSSAPVEVLALIAAARVLLDPRGHGAVEWTAPLERALRAYDAFLAKSATPEQPLTMTVEAEADDRRVSRELGQGGRLTRVLAELDATRFVLGESRRTLLDLQQAVRVHLERLDTVGHALGEDAMDEEEAMDALAQIAPAEELREVLRATGGTT